MSVLRFSSFYFSSLFSLLPFFSLFVSYPSSFLISPHPLLSFLHFRQVTPCTRCCTEPAPLILNGTCYWAIRSYNLVEIMLHTWAVRPCHAHAAELSDHSGLSDHTMHLQLSYPIMQNNKKWTIRTFILDICSTAVDSTRYVQNPWSRVPLNDPPRDIPRSAI